MQEILVDGGELVGEHRVQILQDLLLAFHIASRIAPAPDPADPCSGIRTRLACTPTRRWHRAPMRNTGLLGRLQLGGLAVGRALFAQNLLGRVLALAAVCADTEALAQVVQAAPEPGAVANL